MNNTRNVTLDICRGGAIFLVLLGHIIQYGQILCDLEFWDNYLFKIIYSFHMPLLMLISGFCFHFSFEKKNTRELLISRITPLLQAIFIFSILSLILCEFKKPTSGRWVDSCFGIWFLWSIIASCIPLTLIFKSNKNKIIKILLLFFSPLFIILFPNYDIHLYVYPYFILGFIFAFFVKNDILKKVTKISWISIPLFILMLIFYKKEHYIYITGIYGRDKSFLYYFIINLFRFSIGIFGSISFINIIIYLQRIIHCQKIEAFFSKLGIYSLQIYLLQRIIVESWYPKLLLRVLKYIYNFYQDTILNTWSYNLLCILISLFFAYIIVNLGKYLTDKFGKILFGKY